MTARDVPDSPSGPLVPQDPDTRKVQQDPWQALKTLTQARIALGRAGDSLSTASVLAFEAAQARARDAVHTPLDTAALAASVEQLGFEVVHLQSSAPDRATYLRRPDAGRRLAEASRRLLLERQQDTRPGITLVLADGLSSAAVANHAVPLMQALQQPGAVQLQAPVFIATQARVALGDEIGELTRAQAVLVLIGERPGLTTPDSLGAYLTWNPRIGLTDAERNCVSNIHAGGLSYSAAARKLMLLMQNARQLGATGIYLHDESEEHPALPE